MTDKKPSIAASTAQVFCPAPVIKGLTKEQIAALIEFKKELVASLQKLYLIVPETEADLLLKQFVATLP